MKKINKFISLLLVFCIVSTIMPCLAFSEAASDWDVSKLYQTTTVMDGYCNPFTPVDKYVSMQNPPRFTWTAVLDMHFYFSKPLYKIRISSDFAQSDVIYEKETEYNFHVLNGELPTGIELYWSVCYKKSDGNWSQPSDVRRFRIDPDAITFTVEPIDTLLKKVPETHPRIMVTADKLDEFRGMKDKYALSKQIYDEVLKSAGTYLNRYNAYPTTVFQESKYTSTLEAIVTLAYAYLLSGNEIFGKAAIEGMKAQSKWNLVDGVTTHAKSDVANKRCFCFSAYAYDWVYDLLETEDKESILAMLETRFEPIKDYLVKIPRYPDDSHGWSIYESMMSSSLALYGETDWANDAFKKALQGFIALSPRRGYQDGGSAEGTGYAKYGRLYTSFENSILARAGIVNMYDTITARNEYLWLLYADHANTYGNFGDESYNASKKIEFFKQTYNIFDLITDNHFINDNNTPVRNWLISEMGTIPDRNTYTSGLYAYWKADKYDNYQENIELPINYPYSHLFKDSGLVVMTSDLTDTDRVQMSFKSSQKGTANHSHCENNAFVIEAFGEPLAITSGYYDENNNFNSDHRKYFVKPSFSHNTITVDGGKGQKNNSFNAQGEIKQFVNQMDFDSVTADAAKAYIGTEDHSENYGNLYSGNLSRFDRSIIYIRPHVFVVIDDLKAKDDQTSTFDWWLNAEESLEVGQNTALISKGDAKLKAKVAYPENVTADYYDKFVSPVDKTEHAPVNINSTQKRVAFRTEAVNSTKMVVSMSLYNDSEVVENTPSINYFDDYMELTYNDGTKIFVSLLEKDELVDADGIKFKGTAVTINSRTIMLTDGTYLEEDGDILIDSEEYITAAIGMGQICLSSNDDFIAKINADNEYISVSDSTDLKLAKMGDADGRELSDEVGITAGLGVDDVLYVVAKKDNYTIVNLDKGVFYPKQLKAEDVYIQKSGDNKAAAFWDKKEGRTYDIKIGEDIYENVSEMPFVYNVKEDTDSIFIRENFGLYTGDWQLASYVSKVEKEKHDKIVFSEETRDGVNYVKATTIGFPSFDIFNMHVAKFDKNGALTGVTQANRNNNLYTAEIEKPENGSVKAYVFGKDITPLTSVAVFGTDTTDINGIYLNGILIDDFNNEKNEYTIDYIKKGVELVTLPVITVDLKDGSSRADVKYDFENLKSTVIVTSPSGKKREIVISYILNKHAVKDAIENSAFGVDRDALNADATGYRPKITHSSLGKISYTPITVAEKNSKVRLSTDLRGNNDGSGEAEYVYGSYVFYASYPKTNNHIELKNIPKEYQGWDYFPFPTAWRSDIKNNSSTDVSFTFQLEYPAKVTVLSSTLQDSLCNYGFEKKREFMYGRGMNKVGAEDRYYNIDILERDASELNNYYINNYKNLNDWVNVAPISSITQKANSTDRDVLYETYVSENPQKSEFVVTGTGQDFVYDSTMSFTYSYTKRFEPGEVKIYLPEYNDIDDSLIVVIKRDYSF